MPVWTDADLNSGRFRAWPAKRDLPPLAAAKVALYRTMREEGVSKAALARRMDIQAPQIDRLLDLYQTSRLEQVTRALAALGKRLAIEVSNTA